DDHPRRAPDDDRQGGGPDRRHRRGARGRARRPRHAGRARRRLRRALPRAGARGRARGGLMADDVEIGAYDARIIRRLWEYVRPYRRVFWLALLLSPLQQVFSLVQPYLVKLGIDRYIQHGDEHGLRQLGVVFGVAIVGEFATYYWQQYLTMVVA